MNALFNKLLLSGILASGLLTIQLAGEVAVSDIATSLVDNRARTIDGRFGHAINGKSFQQEVILSHRGYQYLTYYDASGFVCLARRKLQFGEWEILRLKDYVFTSDDAHNIISLGICPADGTIHLSFDHHRGPLHYRKSKPGVASDPEEVFWNASLFGPVQSELEAGKPPEVTYPRFFQTPDGGLQFCYRRGGSGNGDRMMVDYCPDTGKWMNGRQIDSRVGNFTDMLGSSDSRCSYPNGYTYGPDGKLHVSWVWREGAQGTNHDLMYAYSEDGGNSWKNNEGKLLDKPPSLDSEGIKVVEIPRDRGLMNTHGQAVDSKGRLHVVMRHTTNSVGFDPDTKALKARWGELEDRQYHHYFRELNGTWKHRVIPGKTGSRPKVFVNEDDDLILIHGRLQVLESGKDESPVPGSDLVVASASAKSGWTDWKTIHVEEGPFVNEMLGDPVRFEREGVLSVIVQDSPPESRAPTPLRVLDFTLSR